MARYFALFLFLGVTLALPFFFWGDQLTVLFEGGGALDFLSDYGAYAGLISIILLVGDLLLPIPTGAIFGALGILYGPVLGGLVGAVGSLFSGLIGYGLCRRYGQSLARKLAGDAAMGRGERLFASGGGWLVVFSRWLPVLPEAVACLAGLSRMPFKRFLIALLCGVIPVAYIYAWVGHTGADRPVQTLLLCAVTPLLLWIVALPIIKRLENQASAENSA